MPTQKKYIFLFEPDTDFRVHVVKTMVTRPDTNPTHTYPLVTNNSESNTEYGRVMGAAHPFLELCGVGVRFDLLLKQRAIEP